MSVSDSNNDSHVAFWSEAMSASPSTIRELIDAARASRPNRVHGAFTAGASENRTGVVEIETGSSRVVLDFEE